MGNSANQSCYLSNMELSWIISYFEDEVRKHPHESMKIVIVAQVGMKCYWKIDYDFQM